MPSTTACTRNMNISRVTPFRQLSRAYSALLEIQSALSRLANSAKASDDHRAEIEALQKSAFEHQHEIDSLKSKIDEANASLQRLSEIADRRPYTPLPPFTHESHAREFMSFSTCSAADFFHPRFQEICGLINRSFTFHRKLWEWVFIIHHLTQSQQVRRGARGLVFGVGSERLPALFAKMGARIVATDAPEDMGASSGWKNTGEHSSNLSQIRYTDIIDGDVFDDLVTYETCDMNHIPDHLTGFDFNWSSCCFEHLGDIEAGMQFVINAVEKTLRIGGVAVHTTEFNLSSDEHTLESGPTVIYRRRDIQELVDRLRDRGHEVQEFRTSPDSHPLDYHVDAPPFKHVPHLKLILDKFTTTSVGIVVRRGK